VTRNILLGTLAAIAGLLGSGTAFGQYDDGSVFPGIGMGGMVQQELQFSAMMDQQARQFCHNWYEQRQAFRRQHNYWGPMEAPVTTADLVRSNRDLQQTYERQNAQWHVDQQRQYGGPGQVGTVGQFSDQGIRGNVQHVNPVTGEVIGLPYGPNGYRQTLHGQFRPTHDVTDDGYGTTFVPGFGPFR